MPPRVAVKGKAAPPSGVVGSATKSSASGSSHTKRAAANSAGPDKLGTVSDTDSDAHSEDNNKIRNAQVATTGLRRSTRTSLRNSQVDAKDSGKESHSKERDVVTVDKKAKGGKAARRGKDAAQLEEESAGVEDDNEAGRAQTSKRKKAKTRRGTSKRAKRGKTGRPEGGKKGIRARAEESDEDLASDEDQDDGDELEHIERGGPAARQFWTTIDIRERVFALLDKHTLTAMARVEKGVTAGTAKFLYHTIPAGIISGMSRASGRRVVYCDAVRVIDETYFPEYMKDRTPRGGRRACPESMGDGDAARLVKRAAVYQRKCPNARRVEHEYPPRHHASRFVLHFDVNGRRELDLHEYHAFEAKSQPGSQRPVKKNFDGIDKTRRTVTAFWPDNHFYRDSVRDTWVQWLNSEDPGPLITGIDFDTLPIRWETKVRDVVADLNQRDASAQVWRLSRIDLPELGFSTDMTGASRDAFEQNLRILAPLTRACRINLIGSKSTNDTGEESTDDINANGVSMVTALGDLLDVLGDVAPNLLELDLAIEQRHLTEASLRNLERRCHAAGLHLRRCHVRINGSDTSTSRMLVARVMAQLGSDRCFYSFSDYTATPHECDDRFKAFNRFVRLVKSSNRVGRVLRGEISDASVDAHMFHHFGGVDGSIIDVVAFTHNMTKKVNLNYVRTAGETVAKLEGELMGWLDCAKAWRDGLRAAEVVLRDVKDGESLRRLKDAWAPVQEASTLPYRPQRGLNAAITKITRAFEVSNGRGAWIHEAIRPGKVDE